MKTVIFLLMIFFGSATLTYVTLEYLEKRETQENVPEYKIVRDTILIDLSRQKNLSLHEYQLELTSDSIYIYEGQRLVKVIPFEESINEVLINDNL